MSTLLEPATTPAECASWLPREELTRLAMRAYEMARLDCFPKPGQPFMADGSPWCDRQSFMDFLLDNLALLIGRYGVEVGMQVEAAGADRLELLEADFRAHLAAKAQRQEVTA